MAFDDRNDATERQPNDTCDDSSGHLSRSAWGVPGDARKLVLASPGMNSPAARELEPMVMQDGKGHVSSVDNPDGTSFEYSNYDGRHQPTVIRMKTGTAQEEWRKEGDNLWRQYDTKTGHPLYRVHNGEYFLANGGQLYTTGQDGYKAMPYEKSGPYGAYTPPENPVVRARKLVIATPDSNSPAARDLAPLVIPDDKGHVTSRDNPDGTSFDYSNFDAKGQPTVIRMKTATAEQEWRKEGDNLWRQYDPKDGTPYYRVLKGEYFVANRGQVYTTGEQDYMALPHEKKGPYGAYHAPDNPIDNRPAQKKFDDHDHVTRFNRPDGTGFQYRKFAPDGQPTSITMVDHNTGYKQEWRKETDNLWRAYSRDGRPMYQVFKGQYVVDKNGELTRSSDGQTTYMALPGEKNGPYGSY